MGASSAHRPVHRPESSVGIASVTLRPVSTAQGPKHAGGLFAPYPGNTPDTPGKTTQVGQLALGRPPRPQRKTAVASVGVELDRQDLVKLNDIRLEAQP